MINPSQSIRGVSGKFCPQTPVQRSAFARRLVLWLVFQVFFVFSMGLGRPFCWIFWGLVAVCPFGFRVLDGFGLSFWG